MTAKQQTVTVAAKPPPPTVTAVKGNLITKSSPLATDSCKLEKQFIVAQNMVSHYKRVIGAKPSIDNKPPTSMVKSQKARDRARREMAFMRSSQTSLRKSMDTARSTQSLTEVTEGVSLKSKSATSNTIRRTPSAKDPAKPRVMPDQAELNRQMSEMMLQFTKNAPSGSRIKIYRPQSSTFNPSASTHNFNTSTTNLKAQTIMNTLYSPKDGKQDPNRSGSKDPALAATSRLVSGKSYDVLDYRAHKFTNPNEFQPRINKRRNSKSKLASDPDTYQPPPVKSNQSTARTNEDDGNSFVSITPRDNESEFIKSSRVPSREPSPPKAKIAESVSGSRTKLNSSAINESLNRSRNNSHLRDTDKEENLKYLAFVKEVTDDVIARGISSNATINNCFEYHIDKNRGILDEAKMRDVLETLRRDLGMPSGTSRNKENIQVNGDYLTLKKFGVHSVKTSSTRQEQKRPSLSISPLNNSGVNAWKVINDSVDEQQQPITNLADQSVTTKLYESYETHIVKNIQSIRRKSLEDADQIPQSGLNSLNNSKLVKESSRRSSQTGLVNSSSPPIASSPQHPASRRASNSSQPPANSSPKPILKKNKSTESVSASRKASNSEDDDDLIFTPKKPVQQENVVARRKKSSESLNNQLNATGGRKGSNSLNRSAQKSREESMEDVFNDDYGDSENDADYDYEESERMPQQAKFLKTKTFTNSELTQITKTGRRSSGSQRGSVDELSKSGDPSTTAGLTPSVTPRKSLKRQPENDEE